ncbi:MAG: fatty acid desaturase [Chloroflexota bacterium]|nr:fatty acid desaturase [Chloroflexota bacterium]
MTEERTPHAPGGLTHKIVITIWALGPLLTFPFALYRAVKTRRIGRKVVATTIIGYLLTGQGITLGFHRLATHESFKVNKGLKAVILALGSAAAQGPVITWVDNHRRHHIHADQEGDPHSPHADFGEGWRETLKGFLHAHIFWLFQDAPADFGRYTKRLREDKVVAAVDRTFPVWVGLGLLIPGLIAGWRGFVWGGVIRMLLVNHATFAVNSICHMFGSRRFQTKDESRNNWFIALLTGGEGNHNNHHANAKAAYHGLTWREYDLTGYVIRALAFFGLAWDVHQPTEEEIEARQRQLARQTAAAEADAAAIAGRSGQGAPALDQAAAD